MARARPAVARAPLLRMVPPMVISSSAERSLAPNDSYTPVSAFEPWKMMKRNLPENQKLWLQP